MDLCYTVLVQWSWLFPGKSGGNFLQMANFNPVNMVATCQNHRGGGLVSVYSPLWVQVHEDVVDLYWNNL